MVRGLLLLVLVVLLLVSSVWVRGASGVTLKLGLVTIAGDADSEQTRRAAVIAGEEVKKSFDFDFQFLEYQIANRSVGNNAILSLYEQGAIGVVGPPRTSVNLVTAVTGGDFFLPTLSPTATIRDLSDKSTYPYFLRTIPSDSLQVRVLFWKLVNISFCCLLLYAYTYFFFFILYLVLCRLAFEF